MQHMWQLHLQKGYNLILTKKMSLARRILEFKYPAELTMKTYPQNSDYVVEFGASRNYKPWRAEDEDVDKEKKKKDAEEMGNAMKALENRALDSKREMDILAALDDMKSMKSRHATVSSTAPENEKTPEEEDEALIRLIFLK
ncbi:hypothetical protein CUMW_285010 [Citrus unshiu]|uniref:Uncharacterized protein n=1 Tax=Citrus unshiu TaxID=55188 RepID=A0A2H5MVA7_CITUN|nr:hypothetical protein CUMW_285010 [Citrus unshiu]